VIGYEIHGIDGKLGEVRDFIVDDDTWNIRYLVVGMRSSAKLILVSPMWIEEVDWNEQTVQLDVSKEAFEASPAYDPTFPINREYEVRLYDYHGRPKYWS
jgi:hypothetical protein